MKLIINIENERYELIKKHGEAITVQDAVAACEAVANGKALPRGRINLLTEEELNEMVNNIITSYSEDK